MDHFFLYGPPGSGKSSVGRVLAQNLNLNFLDLDAEIERYSGTSIPQIMEGVGESGFRDIEFAALLRAIEGKSKVISLGGGALLRPTGRAHAEQSGTVVFLDADHETLLKRLTDDENVRPLLAGSLQDGLDVLLVQRASHYASFKTRLATTQKTPEQIAAEIQVLIGRYHVRGMGQGYDVIFKSGGFNGLVDLLRERDLKPPVAIVCDENVAPLYGEPLLAAFRQAGNGYTCPHMIAIPAGEDYKTLDSITKFWRSFLEAGLDRKSTIVALGGGVIGDMSGFAASTFMRGISWVNIPTTVLSMVDASVGGKTGFDLPEGKNLIGSFYPPRLVLVNPDTLSTLPKIELLSGLAEVVKHGVIADPELFDLCSQGLAAVKPILSDVVRRAMAVKIKFIQEDPYERGIRAALNLGHTIGHAVELVSDFKIRHGEAVAMGMVAEARLAERLMVAGRGLSETIAGTLSALGLPVEIPKYLPRPDLIQAMRMDKKKERNVVKFALPVKIGEVKIGVAVEDLKTVFAEER